LIKNNSYAFFHTIEGWGDMDNENNGFDVEEAYDLFLRLTAQDPTIHLKSLDSEMNRGYSPSLDVKRQQNRNLNNGWNNYLVEIAELFEEYYDDPEKNKENKPPQTNDNDDDIMTQYSPSSFGDNTEDDESFITTTNDDDDDNESFLSTTDSEDTVSIYEDFPN